MKERIALLAGICLLAACGGRTPVPVPTPTPPPPPELPQLLVRADGVRLTRDGQPFTPNGAVQCCMATKVGGAEINTLWPLASEAWMDYAKATGGSNMFHFRMGPFYGDPDHESEWTGGPYAAGPGSDWNPAFWDRYRALLAHARKIGANVEVVVVDTWYCKRAQWGDQQIPWPKADIEACGRRPSPEVERYVRKVVSEAKDAPHVIWITDNEGDQIQGETCAWFEWVRSIIRDEEAKSGGAVRMVGTNNPRCGAGPFDYVATHAKAPLTVPLNGKHTENNERNPAFSVEQEFANYCSAQAAGLHYWYWRAEMSDADAERLLALRKAGCGGPTACFAPESDDERWDANPTLGGSPELRWAVNSAKLAVGERCGTDHNGTLATIGVLAAELRARGYCASGPWGDALAIRSPTGLWQEFHVASFANGCWSNNPEMLPKMTWSYLGPNPAPTTCTKEVPVVDEILCKLHQSTNHIYDCTPKYRGQPILPEGDPQRQACELKAMGGASPTFAVDGGLDILPHPNPLQFQIRGSGSGVVTCRVPARPGALCNLRVTR